MSDKKNVNRPSQHLKIEINPISTLLKNKIKLAFSDVVNRIKDKHLS